MNSGKLLRSIWPNIRGHIRKFNIPGVPGSGAGKGGGAGGAIRESGGGLGKFGAAQEEGYFYDKQREQLQKIKQKLKKDEPQQEQKPAEPNV